MRLSRSSLATPVQCAMPRTATSVPPGFAANSAFRMLRASTTVARTIRFGARRHGCDGVCLWVRPLKRRTVAFLKQSYDEHAPEHHSLEEGKEQRFDRLLKRERVQSEGKAKMS